MGKRVDELRLAMYEPSTFTRGCLEIRLFYVRIAFSATGMVPDYLTLRHLRREIGVSFELNGIKVPSSDAVSITLRRDRVNKDSSEVTYLSTDSVKVSGPVEFEVCENGDQTSQLVLCGSLERVGDSTWSNGCALENGSNTGWSMDCYPAASIANGRSAFSQPKIGGCSPSIEVYIAGCCSGLPVILTKTTLISPKRKVHRHGMLDSIPEEKEIGKEDKPANNGFISHRKIQSTDTRVDDYELQGKLGNDYYREDMYPGEDGELSWFNAGVRVGVGIGLGMCLGVGIGVGLLMRSYQATTRTFRRRFF